MSLILELPEVLVHGVITIWLSAKELGRLDSALCSWENRAIYLRGVQSPTCVLHCKDERNYHTNGFPTWAIKRQVAVSTLHVTKDYCEAQNELRAAFLKGAGKHVQKVIIYYAPSFHSGMDYESIVMELCDLCPHVQALTMAEGDGSRELMNKSLELMTTRCRQLNELIIHRYLSIPAPQWSQLFKSLPHLRKLSTFCYLDEAAIRAAAAHCPLIEELPFDTMRMNDACLLELATGCPRLCSLCLVANHTVFDEGLRALAANGALVTLTIKRCEEISEAALRFVAEQCSLLREVTLFAAQLSWETIWTFGRCCRNLHRLSIEAGIEMAGNQVNQPLDLLQLQVLEMSRSVEATQSEGFKPALTALLLNASRLTTLTMPIDIMSVEELRSLAVSNPLLQSLTVRGVTDDKLAALAHGCSNARHIIVVGRNATQSGLRAIAASCPKLECIRVPIGLVVVPWRAFLGSTAYVSGATLRRWRDGASELTADVDQCYWETRASQLMSGNVA